MNIFNILTRQVSGVPGVFRVDTFRGPSAVHDCFLAAEKVDNSLVWFPPGEWEITDDIIQQSVSKAAGSGPTLTRIKGNGAELRAVYHWPILMSEKRHTWEGFTLSNGRIVAGGSYGTMLKEIFFVGRSHVKCLNAVPLNNEEGVWTEGIRLLDCQWYDSTLEIRVDEGQPQRRWQSFANFQSRGCQMTVNRPIDGILISDHANLYASRFEFKFNLHDNLATAVHMESYSCIKSSVLDMSTEGPGIRLKMDDRAELRAQGKFWRQHQWAIGNCFDQIHPGAILQPGILDDEPETGSAVSP